MSSTTVRHTWVVRTFAVAARRSTIAAAAVVRFVDAHSSAPIACDASDDDDALASPPPLERYAYTRCHPAPAYNTHAHDC